MKSNKTVRIAISNEKGGVGKTTTAVNLAGELAKRGYKTLLLDTDSQGYASSYFHIPFDNDLSGLFMESIPFSDVIIKTPVENLDLIPANRNLAKIEGDLWVRERAGEQVDGLLEDIMTQIDSEYDFVVIDCPPRDEKMKKNILCYTDYIIIPTIPDDNAIEGIDNLFEELKTTKETNNGDLKILGLLFTIYEQTVVKKAYLEVLKSMRNIPHLNTLIRRNTTLAEARNSGYPICFYRPNSNGGKDYTALTDEILKIVKESEKV